MGLGPTIYKPNICPRNGTEDVTRIESRLDESHQSFTGRLNSPISTANGVAQVIYLYSGHHLSHGIYGNEYSGNDEQGIICNILAYAHTYQIVVEIFQTIGRITDIRTIVEATDTVTLGRLRMSVQTSSKRHSVDRMTSMLGSNGNSTHEDSHLLTSDDILAVLRARGREALENLQ
ncbi:hypothetical protein L211DRAFT_851578 [Terfezia boudieri ATCC MYA-4762]|uniref:Uncharacterized protein n=1 Tax=Terfezia boudieri ATCC MYA-4762 TaxID=1051890 RepID=A0A3N4LT75_9PEZI|nr:hypothetical protein L211DRAFT_851578 [Terfezia boudieri ATCC MYA-4762]